MPDPDRIPPSLAPDSSAPQSEAIPETIVPSSVPDGRPGPSEARQPLGPAAARYSLRGEVGQGGMGVVLAAFDPTLNRDLALKVLRREYADHGPVVQRFREEAQIGG